MYETWASSGHLFHIIKYAGFRLIFHHVRVNESWRLDEIWKGHNDEPEYYKLQEFILSLGCKEREEG